MLKSTFKRDFTKRNRFLLAELFMMLVVSNYKANFSSVICFQNPKRPLKSIVLPIKSSKRKDLLPASAWDGGDGAF